MYVCNCHAVTEGIAHSMARVASSVNDLHWLLHIDHKCGQCNKTLKDIYEKAQANKSAGNCLTSSDKYRCKGHYCPPTK